MPTPELWSVRLGLPGSTVRWARRAEDEGWDGIGLGDSQNLAGDVYAELALAATATSRLGLSTAVTNPLTRHPAVTSAAIVTVQAESQGRAFLGIGRGDSALAHLGLAPVSVGALTDQLRQLRGYLRGEEVPFAATVGDRSDVRSSDTLGLAGGPAGSRLQWLPRDLPPVPIDVFATGPRVIAAGACLADRVTFAVGSDPTRLRWALELARETRIRFGLGNDQPMGAFFPLVVHPDRSVARSLIAGGVASFARFSVMHGQVSGPVSDDQRRVLEHIHASYDMNSHFASGSPQSEALTDDVIDAFGIAGPAAYCVERLTEIADLGIGRIFVNAGVAGADHDEMQASRRRLAEEVIPALK